MDGALSIILLCVAMFGGSVLLGLIPLLIRLPEEKLRFVSVLGAGLLCGTALAIIIPEGMELLVGHLADKAGGPGQRNLGARQPPHPAGNGTEFPRADDLELLPLFDELPPEPERGRGSGTGSSLTATLGLVIHAAVDGVALGTAAGSSQVSLQVIVFFAVILHKAPASFGLVSYLLHAGLEKRHIYRHLLAFSLAAPLLAIMTFFIVRKSSLESLQQTKATGIGLLFSAGTFLYVASVHVLPEVSNLHLHQATGGQGPKGLGFLKSLTLIVGCTIPVFLSLAFHEA
ncbi:zinc transporter ZIP9-like isoform X2 [Narcine bancroftii]|uniref:zinc transporter ZIP9-like isoform X2 n=1 Tax=Narcine bancroftii TaxID=1343680 RepID=UPI0038313316